MKRMFLFLISILAIKCISSKKDLTFLPLDPYFKDNKFNNAIQRYRYYLVEGYEGHKNSFSQIQRFAFEHLDSNYSSYDGYVITFFRISTKTNTTFKETESDLIEWHGEDILYSFRWTNGNYTGYSRYKNGKLIRNKDAPKIIELEKPLNSAR